MYNFLEVWDTIFVTNQYNVEGKWNGNVPGNFPESTIRRYSMAYNSSNKSGVSNSTNDAKNVNGSNRSENQYSNKTSNKTSNRTSDKTRDKIQVFAWCSATGERTGCMKKVTIFGQGGFPSAQPEKAELKFIRVRRLERACLLITEVVWLSGRQRSSGITVHFIRAWL